MSFPQKSPVTARKVLGNNLSGALESVGNNTITRHTPWESPVPVHNPNTSYGLSYNADYGKSTRIKGIGKQIIEKNLEMRIETKSQAQKINAAQKPLLRVVDNITDSVSKYGKRISPLEYNHRIDFNEGMFEEAIEKRYSSPMVSMSNSEWIFKNEKQKKAMKFIRGEFIPNINQLQIYGRKAEKSMFEKRGLWIVNGSFSNDEKT